MKTMQHQRLDSLAEKVEESNKQGSATVTESKVILGSATTLWVDRLLDETLDCPQSWEKGIPFLFAVL